MKRITTVLKESDAVVVRKAVCVAGGERIVITPLPYRLCGVERMDLYTEKRTAEPDKYVRLDVAADNNRFSGIVSAIRRLVRAGKVVIASPHGGHTV